MKWLTVMAQWFLRVLGVYEGAQFSPDRSLLRATVQAARFDASVSTRMELVRRSRYFERNNAIVNRLADIFECYTVGEGLQLTPASSDAVWNEKAREWWAVWTKYCDLNSLQGFGSLQALMARSWFIDGEIFLLLTKGEASRPRLQLIEGHRVRTPPQLAKQEGISVIDGVQIDRNGRPVGYWVGEENERGQLVFGAMTPAESIVHVFEPARAGQYRGLPFLYPVMNELHDLDDLHQLEMKAAKDAAEITNVINNQAGEVSAADLIRAGFTRSKTLSTGATVPEDRNEFYQDRCGGRTIVLRGQDKLEQFRSERPAVVTRDYWRYKTELVCTGVGIPYVLVFPDSMQGTVYRGALDMAASFFRARSQVIAGACARIYEYVMRWASANEPALRDKPGDWYKVSIRPPRAPNVDVGRNSTAMLAELEAGATNFELIYSPLGLDWREQLRKKAEQISYIKTLGQEFGIEPSEIAANKNVAPEAGAVPIKGQEED